MSTSNVGIDIPLTVAADLSAAQFRFMIVGTDGRGTTSAANGKIIGILQNTPAAAGRAGVFRIAGVSKLEVGASVSAGDYLASNAQGFGTTAASLVDQIGAQALSTANGSGDYIDVLLQPFRY